MCAGTSEAIRPFYRSLTGLDEFVLKGSDPSAVGDLKHDVGEVPKGRIREAEETRPTFHVQVDMIQELVRVVEEIPEKVVDPFTLELLVASQLVFVPDTIVHPLAVPSETIAIRHRDEGRLLADPVQKSWVAGE